MKKILYCVIITISFCACSKQKDSANINDRNSGAVSLEKKSGKKIQDALIPVISSGKPNILEISQPRISKTNTNVFPAINKTPRIIKASEVEVFTPGKNNISEAVVKKAKHKKEIAGTPERVPVQKAYSKEKNPHSFKSYTRLQGLKHDDISKIIQDKSGNLWIGSSFSGVTRYDGQYFYHYSEKEGLRRDRVLSIMEDISGNLWFGTVGGGVTKFDGKCFTTYTTEEGLSNNIIEVVFEDSKGNIWLGTSESGVTMFDGFQFKHFSEEQGFNDYTVFAIIEDRNENIWFGTMGGGLIKYDGTSFYHYTEDQGLSGNYILSVIEDRNGDIWVATDMGGITKLIFNKENPDYFKAVYFTKDEGLSSNKLLSLYEDKEGNIWIGTRDEGIIKYDGTYFTHFSLDEGLINESINTIFEDRNGNLWLGTTGGGIANFRGEIFTHYTDYEGISNSNVRSFTQDDEGNIWIGTNGGGIILYDKKAFYTYTEAEGLANNYIRSIIKDSKGNIWIGTSGSGAVMFDGKRFFHYTEEHGLCNNYIFSLFEDKAGDIWFATAGGGVCKLNLADDENQENLFVHYNETNGLVGDFVIDILQDKDGKMWFATNYNGLSMLDGETFYDFTIEEGLVSNEITAIIEDSRGLLWIGHYGEGFSVFDGESIVNLKQNAGLVSNYVFSLLEDRNNNVWIGTRYGLSMLSESNIDKIANYYFDNNAENNEMLFFKNYTHEDGFLGIGCNPRALYEDNEGNIWVGANDILTVYNPQGEDEGELPPKMEVIGLDLFRENIDWKLFYNSPDTTLILNDKKAKNIEVSDLSKWYNLPIGLSLPYYNNFLTFKFVGITTNYPNKVQYQYKLEGLDNNWSSLSSSTEAHYSNLSFGKYTFRVKALSSEGLWSEEAVYEFRIRAPWWNTWQAYLIYTIVIFIIGFFAFRFIRQRIKDRENQKQKSFLLEQEVEIAQKSLEFKKNFLANMSHEIRTPLTGILGMADIIAKTELSDNQREYINTLIHSGESLREIIDLILDYSKLEAGQVKLKSTVFSISKLFETIERIYAPQCKKKGLELETVISSYIPKHIIADMNKVNQILNNLLSNALKFTDKGGIIVKAKIDDKQAIQGIHKNKKILCIKIEVKDTGKGIRNDELEKLFKPFSQIELEQTRTIEGTGLGLSICKELSEMLGGEIGVNNQQARGTTFWFTFKAIEAERQDVSKQESLKDYVPHNSKELTVLLVEDKVVTQKVVELFLNSLGHKVFFANNGKEAIEIYSPGKFDLVLMDIQMPIMDGVAATSILRKKYSELPPIVGLSANAFEGDREKFMSLGLDEYLTKPVKESDFIELLKKLRL